MLALEAWVQKNHRKSYIATLQVKDWSAQAFDQICIQVLQQQNFLVS